MHIQNKIQSSSNVNEVSRGRYHEELLRKCEKYPKLLNLPNVSLIKEKAGVQNIHKLKKYFHKGLRRQSHLRRFLGTDITLMAGHQFTQYRNRKQHKQITDK